LYVALDISIYLSLYGTTVYLLLEKARQQPPQK